MNKSILLVVAAVALSNTPSRAIDLLSLGSDGFEIQGFEGAYTQNDTTLSFGTVALGGTVFGGVVGAPLDWSSAPAFGMRMTVSSGFEPLQFTLSLFDSTFDPEAGAPTGFANYRGNTGVLTAGVEGTISLTLVEGSVNAASIVGLGFTWDGLGPANSTIAAVTAVPEPSTYALLALSALGLGGYAVRRRRRA
jgi:hypothetical protein